MSRIIKIVTIFCFTLISLGFLACERSISKKYDGDFYFTTIRSARNYPGLPPNYVDEVYFHGSIEAETDTRLKITYAPKLLHESENEVIYVDVDENGELSCSDLGIHGHFEGKFSNKRTLSFIVSDGGLGGGYTNNVHGEKE